MTALISLGPAMQDVAPGGSPPGESDWWELNSNNNMLVGEDEEQGGSTSLRKQLIVATLKPNLVRARAKWWGTRCTCDVAKLRLPAVSERAKGKQRAGTQPPPA